MAETTNLPPGGYVVDYSQPNPEANEWEAYQYGYMPNAEKFKQYRVERYDPEFGAYVTDIYNADTGQFYATAKGTENKFLDKVVQPIAMAGLTAAIGSAGANLLGLGGAATGAAAGDIAFAAADAAQLAAQGLGEAQIAQTLATTGLDAFVAADMAQLAVQGLNAPQIATIVEATSAGTNATGLFSNLGPAEAVAQGITEFPTSVVSDADIAGGLIPEYGTNAAYEEFITGAMTPEASTAIENMIANSSVGDLTTAEILAQGGAITDAAAGITPATAASAASPTPSSAGTGGLLSGLTPAQISSLLQAGVGLLGAGAAGSALRGGGGGSQAISPTSLPQQAPAKYDQNYFDALNAYYSTYLPGQQANTSMLSSWYNRQPYQVDQFQMPVMAPQASAQAAAQAPQQLATQQPTGGNMGFFGNVFGSLFDQYLKPNRVTPAAQQPTSMSSTQSSQTSQSPFVTGGGSTASKAEYDKYIAERQAKQQAYLNELINYTPSSPTLAKYFANPETIPLQSGESIDRAILRLKMQDMGMTQNKQNTSGVINEVNAPEVLGLSWLPIDWKNPSQQAAQVAAPAPQTATPMASAVPAVSAAPNLQGLFQEVYGRMGTPEEVANIQGMSLGEARNLLQTSLANWNAMQNR